jgi:hypothetical protein
MNHCTSERQRISTCWVREFRDIIPGGRGARIVWAHSVIRVGFRMSGTHIAQEGDFATVSPGILRR